MRRPYITAVILGLLAVPAGSAFAAEPATFELVLKDHRFTPDRIEVPAGEKVALVIKNQDPTPEEFDSHDLKREKVVKGGQEIRVLVGPLAAGEYKFAGEYNEKTAKGVLVAK